MSAQLPGLVALFSLAALPACADFTEDDAAELSRLIGGFVERGDSDFARIEALYRSALENDVPVSLALFEGKLSTIPEPMLLTAPESVRLDCATTVESPIPLPGYPPNYDEDVTINRAYGGITQVSYVTTDPELQLSMDFLWDGEVANLERFSLRDSLGVANFEPASGGGYLDTRSGQMYGPNTPDAQTLTAISDNVVLANPSWFLSEFDVSQGQAWLRPGGEEDLADILVALAGAGMAGPGAEVEPEHFLSSETGQTDIDGVPNIVFEALLQATISAPGTPPVTMRVAVTEVYDMETLGRRSMTGQIVASVNGQQTFFTQQQFCDIR